MIRILAVGDIGKIDGLMRGLSEEKGAIVDHVVDADMAYKVMRSEYYDLVVLEPDLSSVVADRFMRTIRCSSRQNPCIIEPRTDIKGYASGGDIGLRGIDFIVESCPRRIMEAYEKFTEGSDDI